MANLAIPSAGSVNEYLSTNSMFTIDSSNLRGSKELLTAVVVVVLIYTDLSPKRYRQ